MTIIVEMLAIYKFDFTKKFDGTIYLCVRTFADSQYIRFLHLGGLRFDDVPF